MAVLAVVIGYPTLAAIYQSLFTQRTGLDPNGFVIQGDQFVGAQNHTDIFSGDAGARFWNAFYTPRSSPSSASSSRSSSASRWR